MSAFSLATVSGAEGCLTLPLVDAQPANKAAATTDINPSKRIWVPPQNRLSRYPSALRAIDVRINDRPAVNEE
ncbi:hypothetical protein [Rhizobium gallicum]|uniref:hypothetical protein n=1 Tax=Rhizobium gallicum TaxID=56730 RepID=UPI001EF84DB0|nr:hypothetical protein [Rhizobium gallicum]ULJ76724.1 hypothetical protein L2W42_32735 [Rhizobium gallicum]